MRGSGRKRKHSATEDVGGQLLLSFGVLESLLPISGSEFEQPSHGPGRQQAEQISQVTVGLDVVEPSACEEGNKDGVHLGAIIAADKEPVSTTEDLPAEVELADVVVDREPAIIEEAPQRDALVASIAERCLSRRFIEHTRELRVAPVEELVDDCATLVASHSLFLFSGRVRDGPFDAEERTDVRESHLCSVGI